ncbi:Predicted DNA-binding transcriptional regulator YafY, contains an HTH and WYL domains [Syntrophus gentianae]|uniref:Predicted DNA-binding transcriptional regulator YafY, contains an HTH and WYL domains n=1 Tax=Syntrophus gentianae TaxID=43775 RepID=A0A1H8A864_9BACT|nr:WYL domain-containing protein [Syntrophus gentianae]SEM66676.1 Predicted DNA-binding transcriptional regulator YafY, contains an HTH and WYL domains [Syntrophus gentianae]
MESRLKKSHRLIRLISDIKSAPYLTVEQLLKSHGISRAQFYKDKTALAELGFEFNWDRHNHRFVITRDAYLPIETLSLSERLSLLMAVRQLSATGDYILSFEALNAARKLIADLPEPMRETAVPLFEDLVLREGFGCRKEVLEKLSTAVSENRRVVLSYRKPSAKQSQREELDPYHLFFQDRSLYVEGYACRQKDIRMFRLNRIQDIAFTPIQFTPQEDYNFGQRYRNAFSVFAGKTTEKVVVRFAAHIRPYIEESLWHYSQVITEENDGVIRYEVQVAEPREVMWWAFRWGAGAEIMEPTWLRDEAKKEVERMKEVYGKKP